MGYLKFTDPKTGEVAYSTHDEVFFTEGERDDMQKVVDRVVKERFLIERNTPFINPKYKKEFEKLK